MPAGAVAECYWITLVNLSISARVVIAVVADGLLESDEGGVPETGPAWLARPTAWCFSRVDGVGVGGFPLIEEALVSGDSRGLDHRQHALRAP